MHRLPLSPAQAARAVLVDTGVLVAILNRQDSHHAAATAWLAQAHGALLTVAPVLSKTALFLPARLCSTLADLVATGVLQLHAPSAQDHARLASLFDKYADRDPDWADMELIWLAEASGVNRIATVNVADFSAYRIHGRKRFELALLG
jgi:uncharacterized protein